PLGRRRTGRATADYRAAAIVPRPVAPDQRDPHLSGAAVVREHVAVTVAVEVAGFDNRQGARWRTKRTTADHGRDFEQPHYCLSSRSVEPEDVGEAVAVEITRADNRPWTWR